MAHNQRFDFDRAADLQTKLKGEINAITDRLNKTQNMVEGVREWWKGGSEEAFIKNFEATKREVVKGLEKWFEENRKLISEVAKVKEDQDAELRKAFRT